MKRTDNVILEKIVGYCDDIDSLLERYDRDFEKYTSDIAFQYACNMCIIQIGELVTRLSEELQGDHKEIPWRAIKGMRNVHAHDYEKVDFDIVWNTLTKEIPDLRAKVMDILKEISTDKEELR